MTLRSVAPSAASFPIGLQKSWSPGVDSGIKPPMPTSVYDKVRKELACRLAVMEAEFAGNEEGMKEGEVSRK